jgi:hypothetical protein
MRATSLFAVLSLLFATSASAAPANVEYQGVILQNGTPQAGSFKILVQGFIHSTDTVPYAESEQTVNVVDGVFSVDIGPLFSTPRGDSIYLAIGVQGPTDTAYDMMPLVQVGSVPFALYAGTADQASSVDWANVHNAPPLLQGPPGATGPQGPAGAPGANGLPGATGAQGPSGPQGPAGFDGAMGPMGPTGATGPSGPQGAPGPAMNFTGAWDIGAPYYPGDVVTYNGGVYVCLGNGVLGYIPTDYLVGGEIPAQWAVLSIVGPAGATGPAGPQGAAGMDGPAGPTGPAGAPGPTGPAGPQGVVGAVGPMGPAGPMGPMGPMGLDGPMGAVGPMGPMGPVGAMGPAGPMGPAGAAGANGLDGPPGPMGPAGPAGAVGPTGPAGAAGAGLSFQGVTWAPVRSVVYVNVANGKGSHFEDEAETLITTGCSLNALYIKVKNGPCKDQHAYAFRLYVNGVATDVACSVTPAGDGRCSDLADAVAVMPWDTVSLEIWDAGASHTGGSNPSGEDSEDDDHGGDHGHGRVLFGLGCR